jgi:hypothetical protein
MLVVQTLVIVTNATKLSFLTATGAFQNAIASSEVAGGGIKTITVIWSSECWKC